MLDVTVVVVPRERFSLTARSLDNLYANTDAPFRLVYVSPGAPPSVQRYLDDQSERRGFRLITTGRYLSPNQARNLAMQEVSTKYVVFLDNDALVTPGWLGELVRCADDTNAAIVGPLYLIGEPEEQVIHMAGGRLHFKDRDGHRIGYDEHVLVDLTLGQLERPIPRETCDFVEFHCMLLRRDLFERIGPLDERLLSVQEHIDIGSAARAAGSSVYLEPGAIASYVAPPPFDWSDLPYFMLRWSDEWTTASVEHFNRKWGVASMRHFGDEDSSLDLEDTIVRFARGHRRLATGLRVPGDWDAGEGSAIEQARLMVALLLSVDRDGFDLALTTAEGEDVETIENLGAGQMLESLHGAVARADRDRLNVLVRPRPRRRMSEPALVTLDVDPQTLSRIEPFAFLTLKTGRDRYQIWLAVDTSLPRSASIVRRIAAASAGGAGPYARLAGSLLVDPDQPRDSPPRVALHGGVAAAMTTGMDLEKGGVLPLLWSSQIYE